MTNKEKIKKSINKDFNKKNNYNKIIKMIEGENMKSKNTLWKWSLVPICLVAIICCTVFMYSNNNSLKPNNNEENVIIDDSIKLNINNIKKAGALKFDADIREIPISGSKISLLEILKNDITIPEDLNKFDSYSIYSRKDKNSKYDILNCFVYNYSSENEKDYRNIRIAFSKNNKPLRDYLFSDENSKDTIIKDVKLKIFKYETIYFVEFNYQGHYFDIETNNISEKELLDLLISIIK